MANAGAPEAEVETRRSQHLEHEWNESRADEERDAGVGGVHEDAAAAKRDGPFQGVARLVGVLRK